MPEEFELERAFNLDQIVKLLNNFEERLSRVKIKNQLNITLNDTQEALDYGIDEGVLKKNRENRYYAIRDFKIREDKFYPAVRKGLKQLWTKDGFKEAEFHIETTAGKRTKIVGRWTRPDLTLVSHKKFAWTIGHEFDVVTFEIKRPDSCDVLAVFEALSHATAATRTYVVFPVNEDDWSRQNQDQEARVKDECSRHGVGLILIEDIYRDPKPKLIIKAIKREIDHERCSDFLEAVMPEAVKANISAWK
ncbi:MAG: hypothetical protein DI528_08895 [Shinella sp.]|nr:MAG: hypothetical protein DI528_08895 [Shinella sp.]